MHSKKAERNDQRDNPFIPTSARLPSDTLLERAEALQASLNEAAMEAGLLIAALKRHRPNVTSPDVSHIALRQLQAMDS